MKLLLVLLGLVALTQCAPVYELADPVLTCQEVFDAETCAQIKDIMVKFGEKADVLTQALKELSEKHLATVQEKLDFIREFLVDHATNLSCDKFLPADQCEKLTKLLALIKVNVDSVNRAVREAIAHGAVTAADIFNKARDYARDVLDNATCEQLIDADTCQKLKDFATKFNLNFKEVVKAVKEAMLEHATTAREIYQKAIAFLTSELTCEQVLGAKVCAKLDAAAQLLGEKIDVVVEGLRKAVQNGLTTVPEILAYVQEYMITMVTDFKCSRILSQELCDKIIAIGGRFKVDIKAINHAIEEAIVHGATGVQEIYNVAIAWMRDHVVDKKCEDLIDADICAKIKLFAKKVHVSTADVIQAVKEAIAEGASNPAELLKKAIEYLKAKISCENVMGKFTCDKIRALADRFGIALDKVDEKLREAIASGITKVSDLYAVVTKWIWDSWTDLIGDEEMIEFMAQDDMDSLADLIKEYEEHGEYLRDAEENTVTEFEY